MAGIEFPIAELGNCSSASECKTYCNKRKNHQVCFNFAHRKECFEALQRICQKHPDFSECQKKHGGPGGCMSEEECTRYCREHPDDEECRRGREEYCREHPEECQRMEEEHRGSGGCQSEKECIKYCTENPDDEDCRRGHEEYCRENPEECRTYCNKEEHFEECRNFNPSQ